MNNKVMLSFLFIGTIAYAAPDEVVKKAKENFGREVCSYRKYFGNSDALQACEKTMGSKECEHFYREELGRRNEDEKRCLAIKCIDPGDEAPSYYYVRKWRCSLNDAIHGFKGCHERAWSVNMAAKQVQALTKKNE